MKELISYFAANSEKLLPNGDTIAVMILIAVILYKVIRLSVRMEVNQEELKANLTVLKRDLEVVKRNTGKLKAKQAVTKSKLKELKTRDKDKDKDLKELRELQTSESNSVNKRITAVEVTLEKQASGIMPGPAQVFKLSSEELEEFKEENRRSFQNMQDLLWYIRQDIGVIRDMFGTRNSESGDVKGHATA